ncbi:MAG: hypothetical protein WA049_20060 [Ferribacterium limneticum]
MNKIDEIALRVAKEMPNGFLWSEGCDHESGIIESEVIDFTHALLAELSKDARSVAWGISVEGEMCDAYINKDACVSEFDRRNRLYPDTPRILVELFPNPAPVIASEQKPVGYFYYDHGLLRQAGDSATFDAHFPLFTSPPNTADIEQRTAEACAKLAERDHPPETTSVVSEMIRSGKWREYL